MDKLPTAVINLTHQPAPDTGRTWLLILGIEFEMIVNGMNYEMKNKKMNGMVVMNVRNVSA